MACPINRIGKFTYRNINKAINWTSHYILIHLDGPVVTVPRYRELKPGLLLVLKSAQS